MYGLDQHGSESTATLQPTELGATPFDLFQARIETKTATVLVSADAAAPCSMQVEARLPESAFPLGIEVLGSGWQKQLALAKAGSVELPLPRVAPGPDVVEVRFSANDASLNHRIFGIQLGFHCAEDAKQP